MIGAIEGLIDDGTVEGFTDGAFEGTREGLIDGIAVEAMIAEDLTGAMDEGTVVGLTDGREIAVKVADEEPI